MIAILDMRLSFLLFLLCAPRSLAYVAKTIIVNSKPGTLDSDILPATFQQRSALRGNSALHQTDSVEGESPGHQSGIEEELEGLQEQMSLIEALEERNKAQLESFLDEEDQWNSLEEYEKNLLNSKDQIMERMDLLAEQMIMLWMGQKSQDG